jgi:hypothetical protein
MYMEGRVFQADCLHSISNDAHQECKKLSDRVNGGMRVWASGAPMRVG